MTTPWVDQRGPGERGCLGELEFAEASGGDGQGRGERDEELVGEDLFRGDAAERRAGLHHDGGEAPGGRGADDHGVAEEGAAGLANGDRDAGEGEQEAGRLGGAEALAGDEEVGSGGGEEDAGEQEHDGAGCGGELDAGEEEHELGSEHEAGENAGPKGAVAGEEGGEAGPALAEEEPEQEHRAGDQGAHDGLQHGRHALREGDLAGDLLHAPDGAEDEHDGDGERVEALPLEGRHAMRPVKTGVRLPRNAALPSA